MPNYQFIGIIMSSLIPTPISIAFSNYPNPSLKPLLPPFWTRWKVLVVLLFFDSTLHAVETSALLEVHKGIRHATYFGP